jgi:hypothetical protein
MVRTVTLNADIPVSRELRITLPADVPTGSAAIVIMVSPTGSLTSPTFDDLLKSEFLETHPESPMATALSRFGGPNARY